MLKHFKTQELVDEYTFKTFGEHSLEFFNPKALEALDNLWEFLNRIQKCSVVVNNWMWGGELQWRGFRTLEKAIQLKAPKSEHRFEPGIHLANAFDCSMSSFTAQEVRELVQEHKNDPLLENITRIESLVSWFHFDLKPLRANQSRIYLFKG